MKLVHGVTTMVNGAGRGWEAALEEQRLSDENRITGWRWCGCGRTVAELDDKLYAVACGVFGVERIAIAACAVYRERHEMADVVT